MRDYVSPEELDAYSDLYRAAVDAEIAKQGGDAAGSRDLAHPPPAPRKVTLSLNDLSAAEAARAAGGTDGSGGGERGTNQTLVCNKRSRAATFSRGGQYCVVKSCKKIPIHIHAYVSYFRCCTESSS